MDDLHQTTTKLIAKLEAQENTISGVLNEPVVDKIPPGKMMQMVENVGFKMTNQSNLSADRAKAWLTKMEIMKAQAQDLQKYADVSRERQLESNKQLRETLHELEKFKAENKAQAEVLDILRKGIEQFAKLKAHWEDLLLFFTDISNCVKISMGKPLQSFVKHSSITYGNVKAGKEVTRMDINQIYGPCNNAVKVSIFSKK